MKRNVKFLAETLDRKFQRKLRRNKRREERRKEAEMEAKNEAKISKTKIGKKNNAKIPKRTKYKFLICIFKKRLKGHKVYQKQRLQFIETRL